MPEVNYYKKTDQRVEEIRNTAIYYMLKRKTDRKRMAKTLGIGYSTLNQHLANPRDMRVGELLDLFDTLKVNNEDRIKIIQEVKR